MNSDKKAFAAIRMASNQLETYKPVVLFARLAVLLLIFLAAGCDEHSEDPGGSLKSGTLTVSLQLANLPDASAPFSMLLFRRTVSVPSVLVGRSEPAQGSGGVFTSGTQLQNSTAAVVLQSVDQEWQVTGEPLELNGGTFDLYITIDADGDGITYLRQGSVVASTGIRETYVPSSAGDDELSFSLDYSDLVASVTPEITVATGLESSDTTIYCGVLMASTELSSIESPSALALYSGLSGDATAGSLTFTDAERGLVLPGLADVYCFKDINGDSMVNAGDLEALITGRDLNESSAFIFNASAFTNVE